MLSDIAKRCLILNYSFFIFILALVLHLCFCRFKLKSFTTPFALYGIIWFALLASMQLPIIKFNPFEPITIIVYLVAYVAFLIPNCFYTKKHTVAFVKETTKVNIKVLRRIAFVCTFIFMILVILYCRYVSNYFGGIKYIFSHSYSVREQAIGKQIAPLSVTYGLSIGYVAAGCCAYLLFFKKSKLFHKIIYVLPFACAFAEDLITFSRMGIIFYGIIYLGTYLLKFSILNKKQRLHQVKILFLLCFSLVCILMVPKFIRSEGNIGSSYNKYAYYQGTSNLWGSFLHLYIYATGPLAAFGNYLSEFNGIHTYGQAQFLPIFNLLYRVTGGAISKHTILYGFTSVPFDTNIYTYLREAFDDFGYFGIAITPMFIGLIILICNRLKMRNAYIKVVMMQYVYLYVLFSIFYTPYGQGGPAFGMALYLLIILVFGNKLTSERMSKRTAVTQRKVFRTSD